MVETVLVFSAAFTAVVAVAYGYLGLHLWRQRRADDPTADRALRMFAAWWGLTALNNLMGSAVSLMAAFGFTDLTLQTTYIVLQRLLLAASLAGLMGYLIFLFSGKLPERTLFVLYILFYGYLLWIVFGNNPDGVLVTRWRTDLSYAGGLPAWQPLLTAAILIGPPFVGSLLYLRLLRRVPTRSQRVRILTISLGMPLWWVLAVIAGNPITFNNDVIQLSNRILSALVAIAILLAFEPTPWMRRTFRLEPYGSAPS